MKRKVRIGILGCANIAERQAILGIHAAKNAKLVSIASRDKAKAEEWASRFGARAENSYDSLIASRDIDAVYIPLPIGLHKEWTIKALSAGKHVLCEKSFAENFSSAREMVKAAEKAGLVLFENFACGYHPQHEKILSLVGEGKIGRLFLFRGIFGFPPLNRNSFRYDKNLGGSSLYEVGAYPVFMARKIFSVEPLRVLCKLFFDEENGVDIKGVGEMEFPDGCVASVAFSMDAVYQNNYSLWGEKGMLTSKRAYAIPADMPPPIELLTNENFKESVVSIDASSANQFALIFEDFCDMVLSGDAGKRGKILLSVLAQSRTLEAMRISASEGRIVDLKELK